MAAKSPTEPHEYWMSGCKVMFPLRAYPVQKTMMSKIINGLQKGQHCLLESPTGSGKSLALLCAALAWQKEERSKAELYNKQVEAGLIEPETVKVGEGDLPDEEEGTEYFGEGEGFFVEDPDNPDDPEHRVIQGGAREKKVKKKRVPKIYFGTRTHRQITQIVRELKKTGYNSGVKMSILASRDHTCIHPSVSKMSNRNEGCRELTDRRPRTDGTGGGGGGCMYQSNVKSKLASHHSVNAYKGNDGAWDIEELVKVGKKVRACPYYATRELKNRSDLILCPYNYLVDPLIRKSMEISLKGNIVILDEAHNIEDSARDAAGWSVTQDVLRDSVKDFENMLEVKAAGNPDAYRTLISACSNLSQWIDRNKENLAPSDDFKSSSSIWSGLQFIAELKMMELGPDNHSEVREAYRMVEDEVRAEDMSAQDEDDAKHKSFKPRVSSATMGVVEGLLTVLNYLFKDDMKHRDDYKVALIKEQSRRPVRPSTQLPARASAFAGWMTKKDAEETATTLGTTLKVNFWCMNPAVCFGDIKDDIRSVVLTSGTLSPMASFGSELAVDFKQTFEGAHVVDDKQIFAVSVGFGPTGVSLNGNYKSSGSFAYQDEMGRLTLSICQRVSRGVLLFAPSYRVLNNLTERWMQTGMWQQIGSKKVIVVEPRGSDQFEAAMRQFYDVIKDTRGAKDGVDGALLIAVCRGKVSEGLDFADDNARAVMCVGIPFPSRYDKEVELKMKYNDARKKENKNILLGGQWFEIQAFRALNQALGRCIRHRNDWGAIIMVDERYNIPKYVGSLSKWVRSKVQHYSECGQMLERLGHFNEGMRQEDVVRMEEANLRQALKPASPSGDQVEDKWLSKPEPDNVKPNLSTKKTRVEHKKSLPASNLKAKMDQAKGGDASGMAQAFMARFGFKSGERKDQQAAATNAKRAVPDDDDEVQWLPNETSSSSAEVPLSENKKMKFNFKPVSTQAAAAAKPLPPNPNAPRKSTEKKTTSKSAIVYDSDDDFV